jgi:hypothetical protein
LRIAQLDDREEDGMITLDGLVEKSCEDAAVGFGQVTSVSFVLYYDAFAHVTKLIKFHYLLH